MRSLLETEEEYRDFLKSLGSQKSPGLRINPLKWEKDRDPDSLPFHLTPIPELPWGFLYDPDTRPGKHVLHEAGAYYLQDPDAMRIVPLMEIRPGERVLDLCAAPGGKSTQIAGELQGEGLLVSNEIHRERAKILSSNLERMGTRNCIVCNEEPESLAERFPVYFDKVLCDAPCSGEGMFRKNPEAISEWSPENVERCIARQSEILDRAAKTVRSGGVLVYSTCTFNKRENEEQIEAFLSRHPDFHLEKTLRLFPHRSAGEGHFGAKLVRDGSPAAMPFYAEQRKTLKGTEAEVREAVMKLAPGLSGALDSGKLVLYKEQYCLLPGSAPSIDRLKVLRPGLVLGTMKKDRFEPAHSLALALKPHETSCSISLSGEEGVRFVRGEAISLSSLSNPPENLPKKGFVLMTCGGFSLGFGKLTESRIQNHYPRGLRKEVIC